MQQGLFVFGAFVFTVFWISGLLSVGVANNWKDYYGQLKSAGWTETVDGRLIPLSETENVVSNKKLHQALSWQLTGFDTLQFNRCIASLPLFFKLRRLKKSQRKLYTKDQFEFLENLRLGLINPSDLSAELKRRFPMS